MSEITKIEGKQALDIGTSVENYPDVLSFMCKDIKRSIRLTTYMRAKLNELFGKHNQRFKGNYNYYVWVLEFNGDIFHLYTHSVRGTSISISAKYEDKKTKACISFLKELDKKLKEND